MNVDRPVPIVIAHRGASAYLPEHTSESKAMAYGLGADYLEQDVVATRDGGLVVLHDLYLERVTDVVAKYPDRCRNDGHYYVIDFLLEEVRALNVTSRREEQGGARYPERFPLGRGRFRISTLAEEIELVQGMNAATGRNVGIYTEIKHPSWHRQHGVDLGMAVLGELGRYGYKERSDAAFLQCFDAEELRRLRHEVGSKLALVQLVEEHAAGALTERLPEWARTADVIGWPFRSMLQRPEAWPGSVESSAVVKLAADLGLEAHAYTFRREDLLPGSANLAAMLKNFLLHIDLHGIFCDHPDIAIRAREEAARARPHRTASG